MRPLIDEHLEEVWFDCHVRMFEFFSGMCLSSTRTSGCSCLRSAVELSLRGDGIRERDVTGLFFGSRDFYGTVICSGRWEC